MASKAYIVIIILEAKPGNEMLLYDELVKVADLSRKESTCLEYRLHQDLNSPARLVLYEKWQNKAAHELQFTKPYITSLIGKLNDLIVGPYQAIFAEEAHE